MKPQNTPPPTDTSHSTENSKVYTAEPTLVQFHQDKTSVLKYVAGPYGSGKSTGCIMDLMMMALEQQPDSSGVRKTRWAIVRNTYPELKSTTIKTFEQWVPPSIAPVVYSIPIISTFKQRLSDGTTVHVEFIFLALDGPEDVKKLLSFELTGAYINEGRETALEVVENLLGRIDRYPQTIQDANGNVTYGPTRACILVDSNPPRTTHWLYEKFETGAVPKGWAKYQQPPAVYKDEATGEWMLNPDAENLTHLSKNYYVNQMTGGDDFIRVNLAGEFGMSRKGKPVHPKFSEHKHVAKERVMPIRGLPIILGMDFGLCYSDDTEVLTEGGWKLFKDVDEKVERVATLNPNGFGVEYTPINFKTEYDYDGELLKFKGITFNFMVTPEHRTPYTQRDTPDILRFSSAQELSENTASHRCIQLRARGWQGTPMKQWGMQDTTVAKFLGWYVSEGSIEKIGDSYRVTITQEKKAPLLRRLLESNEWRGASTRWVYNGAQWSATVRNDVGEALLALGKGRDRRVPQWLMGAEKATIKAFLEAYVAGDGHVRTKMKKHIRAGRKARRGMMAATVSTILRDQIQELGMKIGYSVATHIRKARVRVMPDGREITGGDIHIMVFRNLERVEIQAQHVTRVPYTGKIYCLNVPYHTLYVRRGGKACWNGNTPATVILQVTGRGVRALDELPATDETLEDYLDEYVLPLMQNSYPGYSYLASGDPAGTQRDRHTKQSDFMVLRSNGIKAFPAITNNIEQRIACVNWFLSRDEGLLISPHLTHLREAMAGGYVLKETKNNSGKTLDTPLKNEYSHICDALQYGCLYARFGAQQKSGQQIQEKPTPIFWA